MKTIPVALIVVRAPRRPDEYTDSEGETHFRPKREDFETALQWLRADNAFSDRLASLAYSAFHQSFLKGLKGAQAP